MNKAQELLSELSEESSDVGVVLWVSDHEHGIKMMIKVGNKQFALLVPEKQYRDMKSPKEKDKVQIKWSGSGSSKFIANAVKK